MYCNIFSSRKKVLTAINSYNATYSIIIYMNVRAITPDHALFQRYVDITLILVIRIQCTYAQKTSVSDF